MKTIVFKMNLNRDDWRQCYVLYPDRTLWVTDDGKTWEPFGYILTKSKVREIMAMAMKLEYVAVYEF